MLKVVRAQGQGIVSDLGRWGYQHEGVPIGGVLDPFSFGLGNLALGNAVNSACLELMGQFDFVCAKPCQVLFANRGAQALLNNKSVLCGQVLTLQEGDVLRSLVLPRSTTPVSMICCATALVCFFAVSGMAAEPCRVGKPCKSRLSFKKPGIP